MKSFGTPPPPTGLTLHRFPLLNLSSQYHCFSHEMFNGLSSGQCPPNVRPNKFSSHLKVTGLHLVSPNLAVSLGVDFRLAVWKVVSLFNLMFAFRLEGWRGQSKLRGCSVRRCVRPPRVGGLDGGGGAALHGCRRRHGDLQFLG